jgi:hypothetical protein
MISYSIVNRLRPNASIYLGILRSLSQLCNGMSAVQVLTEMRDYAGILPKPEHYATAMLACIKGGQFILADSIFG